ncbi:FG-GAP repeat domain-containing protein [Engelhardtia mirabilis]|uniref:FG-GAP repeat protein n=1 Tax=Engelhardtia mirabilis TaxID=2528011 RepID=A0A518BMZ4_9BACT|nr:FG-GAP repeat protein [Planctomycetes bacterium Pla133]QDV02653.1 FG-GAP repeat protein [Planctomycetes bacterium Pla86]
MTALLDLRSRLVRWLLALVAVAGPLPSAQAQVFGPAESFALPGKPAGLAVGDLDLDGVVDVVVTLPNLAQVAILYGLSGGGFAPAVTHATAAEPVAVTLGDLNGDGRLDIAVACRGSIGVTLLLGKPTGGLFTAGETWATGLAPGSHEPAAVTLADLDRDGDLDVAVGHRAGGFVGVRLGDGDGSLGALFQYDVGGEVRNLVAGSIDGDVYPELVVAADIGGTKILRNQSGSGFTVETQPGTFGGFTAWVELGDADGDGDLDLLWLEDDGIDICTELAPNDGSGVFLTSQVVHVTFSSTNFRATRFGLLDGDAELDVVSTGSTGSQQNESIEVAFGLSGLAVAPQCAQTSAGALAAFELADLDGDGRSELLGTDMVHRTLDVLPGGACGLAPQIASVTPASAPTVGQGSTEVTLSGCSLDDVTSVTVGGLAAVYQGSGCGDQLTFQLPLALPLGTTSIDVVGPAGSAGASIEIVAPSAPVLKILPTGAFSIGGGAELAVGAGPGDLILVIASINNLPSQISGLIELELGGDFSFILLFASVAVPSGEGALIVPVPTTGMPLGGTFYIQTAVATAGGPALPLPTSPLVAGVVVL